jgi:hypothetical protein
MTAIPARAWANLRLSYTHFCYRRHPRACLGQPRKKIKENPRELVIEVVALSHVSSLAWAGSAGPLFLR